jgi:AcrR family transcriptional regulator
MGRTAQRSRLSADDWVAAGLELLAQDGVAAVKVEPLAARLGVTKGSFYWHFDDLPAFLEAMADGWARARDAEVAHFVAHTPEDPRERLRFFMESISEPASWARERAVRAWAYVDPKLAPRIAALDAWAFGIVRDAFAELGFGPMECEIRAKTLYYAGIGFLHTGSLGEPESADHRNGLLDLLTAPVEQTTR